MQQRYKKITYKESRFHQNCLESSKQPTPDQERHCRSSYKWTDVQGSRHYSLPHWTPECMQLCKQIKKRNKVWTSISVEQNIFTFNFFISLCKCNGLNDSFEIKWNITIKFLLFFICDVWPLITRIPFIILFQIVINHFLPAWQKSNPFFLIFQDCIQPSGHKILSRMRLCGFGKIIKKGYRSRIQLLLKRLPDSSISSLIQAGWRQEGHNIRSPKPCFNIPRDRHYCLKAKR